MIVTAIYQLSPILHLLFSILCFTSGMKGLDPGDPKVEEKIKHVLSKRVKEMIQEAREQAASVEEAFPDQLQVL